MTDRPVPAPSLLPFVLFDLVLIGFALALFILGKGHPAAPQTFAALVAVVAAAIIGCWPFVLKHRAAVRLAEAADLDEAFAKLKDLDAIARQISACTNAWETSQTATDKTAALAGQIATSMTAETARFREFMQKSNDAEKRNLTLEADKLRRAQHDWVQLTVALLDQVGALHAAAVRSGQANVVAQLTRFRAVCHDLVRRQGLMAFAPEPGEPFDTAKHILPDEKQTPDTDATVGEVLAPGFTFQGQPLRPALVKLASNEAPVPEEMKEKPPEAQQALL